MNLFDGLEEYRKNDSYWKFTQDLEGFAREIVRILSQYGDEPSQQALREAKRFLLEIERWKAMCLQEQMGMAARNSERSVWEALRHSVSASSDIESLRAVMSLAGFGSSLDQETGLRRAKRATAVLRFLNPKDWGVVDWRTVAILGLLKRLDFDVGGVLVRAASENPRDYRRDLDLINEDWACQVNEDYRMMRSEDLPRAADVDMALFGLSLMAWPMKH